MCTFEDGLNSNHPDKGTPQGGIISPLLANIVLNELDHWIESQWAENPIVYKGKSYYNKSGALIKSNAYKAMRQTNLKEMYIVRYADDFRIFCRTKNGALKTKMAITRWLAKRLKLEVSPEKTRIVNVKHGYSEFLGFKFMLYRKGDKYVTKSHIADKQKDRKKHDLIEQAKNIAKPRKDHDECSEIKLYNSMVMGLQNYYCIATNISLDCAELNRAVMSVFTNRLKSQHGGRLVKTGRKLTPVESKRFGKSKMLRFVAGPDEPIYPIGFIKFRKPCKMRSSSNCYSAEGRIGLHDNLRINTGLLLDLMRHPPSGASILLADNQLSLFSAQWGICAITGKEFSCREEVYCHHINPNLQPGLDRYANLMLVRADIHNLIMAQDPWLIGRYLIDCNLTEDQLSKINVLRLNAGLAAI